ncbi:MAG TPA: NAD(P)-dependent oxidoreductase [Polyangiaceae bacterium]|nr:NAD(P)-dependent oxidoreductase [Polyangiaceae bacterium]
MSQEPKVPVYRIAFVGIGRMGSPMLQCVLEAGYHATLCDPSEQATAPFLAALPDRVRLAPTPRQAAEDADVIEVAVNTNEQLLEACLGSDGVLAGARCGSIVLIHSTVSHDTLRRLGDAASKRGVHLLDAMVSGARGHLSVGNLAVMVGGDAEAFVRAKPVMDTYGGLVLHLGPRGAGLDAKLAINLLRYLCMAAGQEATRLAERTGVGDAMAQLVAHTEANRYVGNSARLRMLESVPLRQREKDAEVAQKDLRAAIARADEVGVRLPSAELAMGLMHPLFGAEPLTDADTQAEQRSG